MAIDKPFSQACENNKQPILEQLIHYFKNASEVLEIGSGTGQHAVHFAKHLPHLVWQTSDQLAYHEGIMAWLADAQLPNIKAPLELDVCQPWPPLTVDGVFSANTAHIMHWSMVEKMFEGVGRLLTQGQYFCLYGPFNRDGHFTSASNQAFDASLKARDNQMGIRDIDQLLPLALSHHLALCAEHQLPANNQLLVWQKTG
jgi:cyclopropane fatty-acyl-phospholipid synthase-like methyltransferase